MKHFTPFLATALLLLISPAQVTFAIDINSHEQQVETLFKLTQMEKKVNQSIDSVMQLQLSQNPQLATR